MDHGLHSLHFDQKQLSKFISSAKFGTVTLVLHPTILAVIVQEHGSANLNQTAIFCTLFFNNEADTAGSFLSAAKKILAKQKFSPLEVCTSMMKLVVIKCHLLWLDEHPGAKMIELSYEGNKRMTQKVLVDQQKDIYTELKKSVIYFSEDREFENRLNELAKELYNIPKRVVIFIFQVNMRNKYQYGPDQLTEVAIFCRYFRGIHWSEDNVSDITDGDYRQIVKRMQSMKISSEHDQKIYNRIGEEIFGKLEVIQNENITENIRRMYRVPKGIMSIIMDMNPNIKSIQELIQVASFCAHFKEEYRGYDDKYLLTIRPSVTGKDVTSNAKAVIQNLLFKLSIINNANDRHTTIYTNLVKRITGNFEVPRDVTETIIGKIRGMYIGRLKIVSVILDIVKEMQPPLDSMKLIMVCSYVCYQWEDDSPPSVTETHVIKHLIKTMLLPDSDFLSTTKTEEENMKKFTKEKIKIPESIIDLIFSTEKGKHLFQKVILCSFFKDESYVENRVSAAVKNLLDDNIKDITVSEKRILVLISKIIEEKKTNNKQDIIYKEIIKCIEQKKVEDVSSCPVM